MAALGEKDEFIKFWEKRLISLLRQRANLSEEDLGYVVTKLSTLKDERFKELVATLIGWGDDERAEMETFCGVALELMKRSRPSAVREATKTVETRFYLRQLQQTTVPPVKKEV